VVVVVVVVVVVAAAAVVVVVVRGGSLLLEHTPSLPTTPITKGQRWGQHASVGRVAQGQRGDGMRVLGVFEKWAGKGVLDFDLKRPTATLV